MVFTKIGILDKQGNNALLINPVTSLDIKLPSVRFENGTVAYPCCMSRVTRKFDEAMWIRLVQRGFNSDGQQTADALWRDGVGLHALGRGLKRPDRPLTREELREETLELIHRLRLPIVQAHLAESREEVRAEVARLLKHATRVEETADVTEKWGAIEGKPVVPEIGPVPGWSRPEIRSLLEALSSEPGVDPVSGRMKKGLFGRELAAVVADGRPERLRELRGGDGFHLRAAIRSLQHQGVPIIGNTQHGYWIARNLEEVQDFAARLRQRAQGERARITDLQVAGIAFWPETEAEQGACRKWRSQLHSGLRSERAVQKSQARADANERRRQHSQVAKAKAETLRWMSDHQTAYEALFEKVDLEDGETAAERKLVRDYRDAREFAQYGKKRKQVKPGQMPMPWQLAAKNDTRPLRVQASKKREEVIPPFPGDTPWGS